MSYINDNLIKIITSYLPKTSTYVLFNHETKVIRCFNLEEDGNDKVIPSQLSLLHKYLKNMHKTYENEVVDVNITIDKRNYNDIGVYIRNTSVGCVYYYSLVKFRMINLN
jgi:hypothetical protein